MFFVCLQITPYTTKSLSFLKMSLFEGVSVDDIFNENLGNDGEELPGDADDNDQIFGDIDQIDGENQQGVSTEPVKVQPKKRNVVNPRPRLNVEVLRGARGLHTIEDYFKDIKFKGKGKEKEDLDEVIRRLQHWGHRMYPTYKFDDVLTNIERLGKKKPLQVHMSRYRLGMLESMKNNGELNDEDNDEQPAEVVEEPYDEFDALLDEQIAISKIDQRTPVQSSSRILGNASVSSSSFSTPTFARGDAAVSTPYTIQRNYHDNSDLATPLPPSQTSIPDDQQRLSEEQLARIAENKRLAQERLAAKRQIQEKSRNTEDCINRV